MTVAEYVAAFDAPVRERLEVCRALVHRLAPDAVEAFSYGLIGYKLLGKPLIYFGAYAHHIGLYATPNGHAAFADAFTPYKQGKGSVQFPLNKELPVELIGRVITYRVEQVMSRS